MYKRCMKTKDKKMLKNKQKTNEGITLIALVITIIILLILAGVAINAIFNQGELFNKANEAVDKWNIALKEENDVIGGLIDDLNSRQEVEVTDNIIISKIPEGSEWTKEDVIIKLSYENIPTGYEIQYKVGRENWTTGTSVTVKENNTTVYVRLYNKNIDYETAVNNIEITNIDKTAPTGIESNATTNSITVKASGGTDVGSGVAGYQYRINSGEWSATIANGTSHTFSGLTAATNYTIEARTVDNVGNISNIYTDKTNQTAKSVESLKVGDYVYYDTGIKNTLNNDSIIECKVLYDMDYNKENNTNYGIQIVRLIRRRRN